ncbi:hypothetical protein RRG08_028612 [Elysia crispata]|uniref:Uncharacterized protein n=1 Tax=Elysia crispata TaxID=231223 RepID=A0AAE0ZU29_9GAST|nr:hypothetical protein RRG08_028612 [Elysia crispata]
MPSNILGKGSIARFPTPPPNIVGPNVYHLSVLVYRTLSSRTSVLTFKQTTNVALSPIGFLLSYTAMVSNGVKTKEVRSRRDATSAFLPDLPAGTELIQSSIDLR